MSNTDVPITLSSAAAARMFPHLTPAQIARIRTHGRVRRMQAGEVLFSAGEATAPFLVVIEGSLEMVRHAMTETQLVTVYEPGQFTGDVSLLSGRRSLLEARAREAGEVIELSRSALLALVQTDAEISEIIVRAFIVRRVELIAQGLGDAIVIGSVHCGETLRVKEFLTRNAHPFSYLDLDREPDVQTLMDRYHITPEDIPVVICRGERVLRRPSNLAMAECLGFNETLDAAHIYDVAVVGSGPAGLAAAVYAASEGLDVIVIEHRFPGGQAGSSSKIENYLGFPTGISGQALAGRAHMQARKFGAHILVARQAERLDCSHTPYRIEMDAAESVLARSVVIATGAEYRRPPLADFTRFDGLGVYYGATFMEAQLCSGEEVIVIGGGNSAGQAAVFLAQTARRVHILVRSSGLAETMSRYLIHRIEAHPAIQLHTHTEIVRLEGNDHLERVRWHNSGSNETEDHPIRHVFVMTGAIPATGWLNGCVALDEKGFIKTGADLTHEDLDRARWPRSRLPYLLETTLPGVFAVGDVRAGNIKRVASAVGEGSISISFVHRALAE